MIIATQIPKTGSTSFLHHLRGIFGPRLFHDCRGPRQAPGFWVLQLARKLGQPRLNRLVRRLFIDDVSVPPGTACISGHFLATKFDRIFPHAQHAIWLRDPVERVASNYFYFRRLADRRIPYCRLIMDADLTLAKFAALPRMRNRQAHFLDRKPLCGFDFVGLTEQYPVALRLAASVFGWPATPLVPRANRNPDRSGMSYPIDAALREHIARLNSKDLEIYSEARELFHERCRVYRVKIARVNCAA